MGTVTFQTVEGLTCRAGIRCSEQLQRARPAAHGEFRGREIYNKWGSTSNTWGCQQWNHLRSNVPSFLSLQVWRWEWDNHLSQIAKGNWDLWIFSLQGSVANAPHTHSPQIAMSVCSGWLLPSSICPLEPEGFFWNGRKSPCHCMWLENYYTPRSSPGHVLHFFPRVSVED